jgi:hypothetical protein
MCELIIQSLKFDYFQSNIFIEVSLLGQYVSSRCPTTASRSWTIIFLDDIAWTSNLSRVELDSISSRFNGTNQYVHFNDCTDRR